MKQGGSGGRGEGNLDGGTEGSNPKRRELRGARGRRGSTLVSSSGCELTERRYGRTGRDWIAACSAVPDFRRVDLSGIQLSPPPASDKRPAATPSGAIQGQ